MVSTKHYEHSCGGFSAYNEDLTRYDYYHNVFSMTATGSFMAEEDIQIGAGVTNGDDEGEEGNVGTSDSTRCGRGTGLSGGAGDQGWLQLGIGSGNSSSTSSSSNTIFPAEMGRDAVGGRTSALLELNLFSDRPEVARSRPEPSMGPSSTSLMSTSTTAATGVMPVLPMSYTGYSRDMSWGLWNVPPGTSSSTGWINNPPSMSTLPRQQHQQQQQHPQLMYVSGSGGLGFPAVDGERSQGGDIRVINPPSRPQIGLWFVLQASHENQLKEFFLPQIPKSYLRIKDGRMTIRLLMKYLVSKLGLDEESEVVITCKGHVLQPYLTLQHVRDDIWCARNIVTVLPDSTANHVMTLQYRRSTATSTTAS